MTPRKLRHRLDRAGAYILAGNPSIATTLDDLRTAAKLAGLPDIASEQDPLAIAIAQSATTRKEERLKLRPSTALLERRRTIFDAALAQVSRAA